MSACFLAAWLRVRLGLAPVLPHKASFIGEVAFLLRIVVVAKTPLEASTLTVPFPRRLIVITSSISCKRIVRNLSREWGCRSKIGNGQSDERRQFGPALHQAGRGISPRSSQTGPPPRNLIR